MSNKKKKATTKEKDLGWKLLPADEVRAQRQAEWNTPDGKAPKLRQCRVQACANTTMRIPPVCDDHFYGSLLRGVRTRLIQDKAKDSNGNGASNGRS